MVIGEYIFSRCLNGYMTMRTKMFRWIYDDDENAVTQLQTHKHAAVVGHEAGDCPTPLACTLLYSGHCYSG